MQFKVGDKVIFRHKSLATDDYNGKEAIILEGMPGNFFPYRIRFEDGVESPVATAELSRVKPTDAVRVRVEIEEIRAGMIDFMVGSDYMKGFLRALDHVQANLHTEGLVDKRNS